jgi:hypothetical protein
MGVMHDSGVLPPLPHPVGLAKPSILYSSHNVDY